MRVVVLGANGFVGRHLCARLRYDGHEVTPITRSTTWVDPVHVVINCAGQLDKPATMVEDNLILTTNLLERCRAMEPQMIRFIQVGSSSEYGTVEGARKETDACHPYDLYSATKLAATNLCLGYVWQWGLNVTIARPFSLYGPDDKPRKMIPTVLRCSRDGTLFKVYPGGHDLIYIDDFIDGLIALMNAPTDVVKGQIFNFGTGISTDNHEVARLFSGIAPLKVGYVNERYHAYDVKEWRADITKARTILGWQPKVSLEEGLRKVINS